MKSLLPDNATINSINRQGVTPLIVAACKYDTVLTAFLLEHGANPSLRDRNGLTALNAAAGWGFPKVVNQLLNRKVAIDSQGPPIYRPTLHSAVVSGQFLRVQHLLRRGANINVIQHGSYRASALHLAAKQGTPKVMEILLEWKPDLEMRNVEDDTPLHVAVRAQRKVIIEQLLKAGADINAKRNDRFFPLADMLIAKNMELAQVLVDHGASTEIPDQKKGTLLHYVATMDDENLMLFMLKANADVEATDVNGCTPLIIAAERGRLLNIGLLLNHGAKVEPMERNGGMTALHAAAANGTVEAVSLLLAFGADPLTASKSGGTAMSVSHFYEHKEARELLRKAMIDAGARFPDMVSPGTFCTHQHDGNALFRGNWVTPGPERVAG
ncbi:MAG: hypothetical protein Q9181_003710 [Wetmoreana brouardii]